MLPDNIDCNNSEFFFIPVAFAAHSSYLKSVCLISILQSISKTAFLFYQTKIDNQTTLFQDHTQL